MTAQLLKEGESNAREYERKKEGAEATYLADDPHWC